MTGEIDCRSCGACCLGGDGRQGWADCTVADVVRMTRRVRAQLVPIDKLGWIHTECGAATPTVRSAEFGGVCAFLRGRPGERVSCRIYETRPEVCRKFRRGSASCREARREIGLSA